MSGSVWVTRVSSPALALSVSGTREDSQILPFTHSKSEVISEVL